MCLLACTQYSVLQKDVRIAKISLLPMAESRYWVTLPVQYFFTAEWTYIDGVRFTGRYGMSISMDDEGSRPAIADNWAWERSRSNINVTTLVGRQQEWGMELLGLQCYVVGADKLFDFLKVPESSDLEVEVKNFLKRSWGVTMQEGQTMNSTTCNEQTKSIGHPTN